MYVKVVMWEKYCTVVRHQTWKRSTGVDVKHIRKLQERQKKERQRFSVFFFSLLARVSLAACGPPTFGHPVQFIKFAANVSKEASQLYPAGNWSWPLTT